MGNIREFAQVRKLNSGGLVSRNMSGNTQNDKYNEWYEKQERKDTPPLYTWIEEDVKRRTDYIIRTEYKFQREYEKRGYYGLLKKEFNTFEYGVYATILGITLIAYFS